MSKDLVVTCAHVVENKAGEPRTDITIVKGNEKFTAEAIPNLWRAADSEDLAVLRTLSAEQKQFTAISIGSSTESSGHRCKAFGYPELGKINGLWAHGEVYGPISEYEGRKLIQIRSREIKGGFSGAPLYDSATHRVIGMISEVANIRPLDEMAFAIPIEILIEVLPELVPTESTNSPLHKFRQRRLQALEKEWDLLFDLFTSTRRALALEDHPKSLRRYELECQELEAKLAEVESKVSNLGASVD